MKLILRLALKTMQNHYTIEQLFGEEQVMSYSKLSENARNYGATLKEFNKKIFEAEKAQTIEKWDAGKLGYFYFLKSQKNICA